MCWIKKRIVCRIDLRHFNKNSLAVDEILVLLIVVLFFILKDSQISLRPLDTTDAVVTRKGSSGLISGLSNFASERVLSYDLHILARPALTID